MNGVILNDGEVAVLIPFSTERPNWIYRRARTRRRVKMTPEDFRERYAIMSEPEELKEQMLGTLGITQKEMDEALQKARTDSAECQYLWQLVCANRRKRALQK